MSSSSRSFVARSAAAAALLAASALLAGAAASTATPAHVLHYIADARPAGSGRLTWFGLHVYDAQLYVPRGFDASRPEARPLALELTYARKLTGLAIAERSHDEIARLAPVATEAQRARWLDDMKALFPDVESGERLAGIYRPNAPTRFYLNGRLLGEVADPDFGRAFFAIWLDPRTSAPQLRSSLLRGEPKTQ